MLGYRPLPAGSHQQLLCPLLQLTNQAPLLLLLLLELMQGRQELRVLGFLQHHPDTSPMFLHRAGLFDRKYNPAVDETKALTHIVLQPSCEWDTQRAPFGPTVSILEHSVVRADSCHYDLRNSTAALEACEVEVRPPQGVQDGLPVGGSEPPVFEVCLR